MPCPFCRISKPHLETIDNQGRCVITDHGSFILLNVYGPAVTNEDNERFAMKMALYEVRACDKILKFWLETQLLQPQAFHQQQVILAMSLLKAFFCKP